VWQAERARITEPIAPAPMVEAQVATPARRGSVPARPLRADALDVRLEVLETAAKDGRGRSPAMAGELATPRGARAAAAHARRREQHQAWAQHSPAAANVSTDPMSRSSPRRTGR